MGGYSRLGRVGCVLGGMGTEGESDVCLNTEDRYVMFVDLVPVVSSGR